MLTELAADPLPDDRAARRFAMQSRDGLVAEVSAFGARLMALRVPLADGSMRDIVVGHDRAGDHIGGDRYSGPICGRFAGRIAGSQLRARRHASIDCRRMPAPTCCTVAMAASISGCGTSNGSTAASASC